MMTEWRTGKLGELVTLKTGKLELECRRPHWRLPILYLLTGNTADEHL